MNKYIVLLLMATAISSSTASAGEYVAVGATVTRVANTSANLPDFAVYVTGGTGPCAGAWIVFPLSAAADADTLKRAYATALLAISTGLKVNIHNYNGSSCNTASYLEVNTT